MSVMKPGDLKHLKVHPDGSWGPTTELPCTNCTPVIIHLGDALRYVENYSQKCLRLSSLEAKF